MKKIGWGVVGYGGMGGYHVRRINERSDMEIIGVYDIDPERNKAAEKDGIKSYPTLEALLADENIIGITVVTPNHFHKEIAIQALESGKDVVCEKPVTLNLKDLEDIIEAANRCGKLFTVHQNRRWDEDYLTARKVFETGVIGKVFRFESRVLGSRGVPTDWRYQLPSGGMVYDWGIHLIDQMLQMMGERKIKSVYTTMTQVSTDEVDDGFTSIFKFDDGIEWIVEVGTNNFTNLPRWYVLADNGTAVIEDWNLNGKCVMVTDWENKDAVPIVAGAGLTKTMAPRDNDSIKEFPLPEVKASWNEFYDNIVDVVNGKAEQLIKHDELIRSMKTVEAVFESGKNNKVVLTDI